MAFKLKVNKNSDHTPVSYTCADYRAEMILLMLHRRLHGEVLSREDRDAILEKIHELETEMGLD